MQGQIVVTIKPHIDFLSEKMRHFVIFSFTAIAGAMISYAVNLAIDWSRNTSSIKLDGKWMSASCDRTADKDEKIAFDVVKISVTILG